MSKRNNTRTLDGKMVAPTVDTPTTDSAPTGTAAHDGTPAIMAPVASAALAINANAKVVTGIPYTGVLKVTGVTYHFKGIRKAIYDLLKDGMTVADFAKAARAGYRGGIEDVRIYVRKGIVVVCDPTTGAQVVPAPVVVPVADGGATS